MVFLEPNLAFSPMLLLTRPRGSAGPARSERPLPGNSAGATAADPPFGTGVSERDGFIPHGPFH